MFTCGPVLLGGAAAAAATGVWSPANSGTGCTFSNTNHTYTATAGHHQCVGALYQSAGKLYFEIHVDLFISTQTTIGLYPSTPADDTWPGLVADGFGWLSSGGTFWAASGTGGAGTYTTGSVLGFAIDFSAGKLWIALNNTWQASGNPGAGTSPFQTGLTGPITQGALGPDCVLTLRTKTSDFTYTPPTGFSSWEGD
jgi:hypothetical protein